MDGLEEACGRFSLDTGAFWASDLGKGIDRSGKVDRVLLEEIRALEDRLVAVSAPDGGHDALALARSRCQELVTCTLFASYLMDRGLAQPFLPEDLVPDLGEIFRSRPRASALFEWLHVTFNGDVFPPGIGEGLLDGHLGLLEDFVRGTVLTEEGRGQLRLFRFRFDTLPIELISSVYEAFARRAAADMAKGLGLHYTPVELVHMALDPIFEGLGSDARILDPTCGSGLFLVQSLRRLVWKRCGNGPRPRSLVREVLYRQVHGIDVQRAALRIAAFSLYLAALELETEAGPGETMRFECLIGLTLHELDFLSEKARTLAGGLGIEAIVGNPPWTHVTVPRTADPPRKRVPKEEGTRRAPDHRFLLSAMAVVGRSGRIAMYLKASPFLSRSGEAASFRDRVVHGLDRLALLNLSPLRHEGLFAGAQSPGLLLCANCGNLPDADRMLVGTFPWTPDFARSGALALSSADVAVVEKERVLAAPSVLKAAMLGTPRDVRIMERLETGLGTLEEVMKAAGARSGQGFQVEGKARNKPKPISQEIATLPAIFPRDYVPLSLDGVHLPSLNDRKISELLFERDRDLYRAPLLLFPKSAHRKALQEGRTSATLAMEDTAFSHGFYGYSFAQADVRLATVLCALLNSAIPGYQFLYGAGALGMERPSILLQDLRALRVPSISVTDALEAKARAALEAAPTDGCAALDAFAAKLYGLRPDERDLVVDGVRRGRSTFLDTPLSRLDDVAVPSRLDLIRYASTTCRTVNAVLRFAGVRHLVASVAMPRPGGDGPLDRFAAVRFGIRPGRAPSDTVVGMDEGEVDAIFADLRGRLVHNPAPYLLERRSLRIYDGEQVTVVKPAQRRNWTVASGLQDGDLILADHAPGGER
ncbi:N-6 DNA methylase [Methylobacterium sp. V23]|uniref:N-6 DNA methylase n=1 Tax=Methylobacterium sp. V23 TaxID=2044878 RepID=UPI0011B0B72C|nr:N-6 DNA methylase [Methylobacterium sp. V23]